MELARSAAASVLPKLRDLHNRIPHDHVELLARELTSTHAALSRASEPPRRLDGRAKAWARDARELAYDVEDAVDALAMSRTADHAPVSVRLEGLLRRAADLSRARSQLVGAPPATVDNPIPPPLLGAAATGTLVGVDAARDALIRRLRVRDRGGGDGDGVSNGQQLKVVSVVGCAGLGKTALAGTVYDALRSQFDCAAFVAVGPDPDIAGVLERMLRQLAPMSHSDEPRDETQLIDQLGAFLQNKRYFIVIDDIWDKSSWEKIQRALVDNNNGSRILTTTRNLNVADQVVSALFELKPLSPDSSKELFFQTIFGHGDKNCCPGDEFAEVADKIIERCGGVPLAIITLAKLLSSKMGDKLELQKVYKCMGSGLESAPEVKNMRVAASRSYYTLPPHLRACMLYLSTFPVDYEIRRDDLVWRWIAEGFIHEREDQQGQSLFEVGEIYFNELVNRSLIQLLDIDYADDGGWEEQCCRVPFPVMDLIVSLSREENLVAVLDDEEQTCSPSDKPVRRLSVRGGSEAEDSAFMSTMNVVPHLRSLSVFSSSAIAATIDLTRCEFLRVLVLEGCDLRPERESHHHLLKHLGSLTHLRYLGLRDTRLATGVPEEIGNLGYLQVLDLAGTMVEELPASVVRLGHLTCLRVDDCTRLPTGIIGSLTALEELSEVSTHRSPDVVKELAALTELRVLRIRLWKPDRATDEAFAESLRELRKIRTLDVYVTGGDARHEMHAVRERWTPPPRRLREFRAETTSSRWSLLRRLPAWVDAPTAPRLAVLLVQLAELRQRDVDALGRLPALATLRVEPRATPEPLAVAAGAFPRLTECRFPGSSLAPVFRRGAAPRLRRLELCFRVRDTVDLAAGNGGFEFGLGYHASLEEVTVSVGCQGSTMEEAAFRLAADGHPNGASFDVVTFGEELMRLDDDDDH